ncbi:hypothetical protein F5X68DRAFT_231686 [Plectosphaerella plurivora]|uniref:Uncharacterized protein n=1 Tax=Plectosphaerella plurivora TaxID=936078 RepID=A0A9P8VCQ3_9PEZI|nr:hypothetical protein F5X68DRAFT_231686 [Plectosphaerella plurivora]
MREDADLLFGIDVGMSCTGVAFLNKSKGGDPRVQVFQNWQGKRVENKTPTRLKYPSDDHNGTAKPTSWGFGCESDLRDEDGGRTIEWFKVDLGDHTKTAAEQENAKRYFADYLACLYKELKQYFTRAVLNGKEWDDAVIEFYFSVPATWSNETATLFKTSASEAGFGSQPDFKVTASLTEPHAVAAYTLCEEGIIKDGESVLIIDAGGGTVDLCLLTVDDASKGRVSTTELEPVKGNNFGSTYIDEGLERLAKLRLDPLECRNLLLDPIDETAWSMRKSFQDNKHEFNPDNYGDKDIFRIPIPGIRGRINDESWRVSRGEMEFYWSDLRELFDQQIDGIKDMIDDMMRNHSISKARNVKVNHVLLSGGLGSSKYVQQKITDYLEACNHTHLAKALLHISGEPQLSVCRGLLAHAKQNMFRNLRARESFGILSKLPWETAKKDKNLKRLAREKNRITTDEYGQQWVSSYVEWFVRRGNIIDEGGKVRHTYSMSVDPDGVIAKRTCELSIMASLERDAPMFNDKGLVRHQTTMVVDLSQVKPFEEEKRWWKKSEKKQPVKIRFIIEAVIGVAEVSFHCLDPHTGRPISKPVDLKVDCEEFVAAPPKRNLPVRESSSSS